MIASRKRLTTARWHRIKSCNHSGKVVEAQFLAKMDGYYLLHVRSGRGAVGILRSYEVDKARKFFPSFDVEHGFFHCTVKSCDNKSQRIELSLEQLYSDQVRSAFEQVDVGEEVFGTVEALGGEGCFVKLESGLVGFLPLDEIPHEDKAGNVRIEELVYENDRIRARVVGKDKDSQRLKLSVNALWRENGEQPEETNSSTENLQQTDLLTVSEEEDESRIRPAANVRSVLVIEDDEIGLGILTETLRQAGHAVYPASSIAEAQSLLQKHDIECILSDIELGDDQDAPAFLVECLSKSPDTMLLIVTGYFDQGIHKRLEPVWDRILDIMVKPLEFPKLLRHVDMLSRAEQFESELEAYLSETGSETWTGEPARQERVNAADVAKDHADELYKALPQTAAVAVIKRVHAGAREFEAVYWKGQPGHFEDYRSQLKYSPVGDVIVGRKSICEQDISDAHPGSCGRIVGLVPFSSLVGKPLWVMGSVQYGLFVFRLKSEFTYEEEQIVDFAARRMELALERVEFYTRIQAQHVLYSLGNLLAGMSHEVANLMTNVTGSVEALGRLLGYLPDALYAGTDTPEQIYRNLRRSSGNVAEVVRVFLGLVKSTKSASPAWLGESIEEVTRLVSGDAHRRNVIVSLDTLPAGLAMCSYPQVVIRLSLFNLVLNALQHMLDFEGAQKRIYIKAAECPDSDLPVQIRIRDTGRGVHEDWRKRIFDPYFTTRPEGTGLGLHIVRILVVSIGGRVSVEESCLFGGTTMLLELPQRGEPKNDRKTAGKN